MYINFFLTPDINLLYSPQLRIHMLDIDVIRDNPERIRKDLEKRKDDDAIKKLQRLKQIDKEWREKKGKEDDIRHERNEISKKINKAKKQGKDAEQLIEKAREIPDKLEKVEQEREELEEKRKELWWSLPNITHDSVPYGEEDEDNEEIRRWGEKEKKDFDQKPHKDVIENLDVADFERSSKLAGAGNYILKGDLALLNQALIRFATERLVKKGFEYQEIPLMLKKDVYETGVSMQDFEDVMYKIEGEDKYLIATSEHPLLGQFKDEVIDEDDLPIKIVGYSMCFRKEVGSHGVDTKGLFRTHQFNKVEQIVLCKPENSWDIHDDLQENAEELHRLLDLPYRVVNVCTGDLGGFASKKYDIETWMARRESYEETTSVSNYTDYQARRANIKYHREEDNSQPLVHTLNGTGIATSRILVSIIENYQNEDGSITIPKVLRPYMFGKERIT